MADVGPRYCIDYPFLAHRSGWAVYDRHGDDQTRTAHFLTQELAEEYAAWKEEQHELSAGRLRHPADAV